MYKESLMREASVLGLLNCRFIPKICDMAEDENAFYIIEEYIEGKSLYDYIKSNGVLREEKVIHYGIKLARLLEILHSQDSYKVCHLDVQPNNILINGEDVYLVDFGNSRCINDICMRREIMVTNGFSAPEQYLTNGSSNMRELYGADIYGAGAVMLYMLTGKYADGTYYKTTEALLADIDIDSKLLKVISEALDINGDYRQITAGVFKSQLENIVKDKDIICKTDENNPCIVSVAGIKQGAGATYAALALTAILGKTGADAVYEENNHSDMIRSMARLYKDMVFDRGCFSYGECRLKPKYNNNVRICTDENFIIRDEGVFDKSRQYGQILIIVMGAGMLGLPVVKNRLSEINEYIENTEKQVFCLFNLCSENAYRKAASGMSVICGYIPFGGNPMEADKKSIHGAEEIIRCIYGEENKHSSVKNEKKGNYAIRRRDKERRNSIGNGR